MPSSRSRRAIKAAARTAPEVAGSAVVGIVRSASYSRNAAVMQSRQPASRFLAAATRRAFAPRSGAGAAGFFGAHAAASVASTAATSPKRRITSLDTDIGPKAPVTAGLCHRKATAEDGCSRSEQRTDRREIRQPERVEHREDDDDGGRDAGLEGGSPDEKREQDGAVAADSFEDAGRQWKPQVGGHEQARSEERRVGKEC